MVNIRADFGNAVRDARLAAGLSQEELALRAGIHRTYVSSVELGKVRIGLEVSQRLAHGLGVPLSQLILEVESSESGRSEILD